MRFSVCGYDSALRSKRRGVFHVLAPEPSVSEALDALERHDEAPSVCDESCWRFNPGGGPCPCYDSDKGGVWEPGC